MPNELEQRIEQLSTILKDGAFPSDAKTVAGWAEEIKRVTMDKNLRNHSALKKFWNMFDIEIQALTTMLSESENLQNREMILKYRNFLRGIFSTFSNAEKRIEQITKRVDDELDQLRNTATA